MYNSLGVKQNNIYYYTINPILNKNKLYIVSWIGCLELK